eukprot:569539-Rhodomonas_salina.1
MRCPVGLYAKQYRSARAMRCAVLRCYEMGGTAVGCLLYCDRPVLGTAIGYGYDMSGTEIGYGATSCPVLR